MGSAKAFPASFTPPCGQAPIRAADSDRAGTGLDERPAALGIAIGLEQLDGAQGRAVEKPANTGEGAIFEVRVLAAAIAQLDAVEMAFAEMLAIGLDRFAFIERSIAHLFHRLISLKNAPAA